MRYYDSNYKQSRKNVYKRDNHTCRFPDCGSKKGVVPHHIKKWSMYPTLRNSEKNLICLCGKHHRMVTGKEEDYEVLFMNIIYDLYND